MSTKLVAEVVFLKSDSYTLAMKSSKKPKFRSKRKFQSIAITGYISSGSSTLANILVQKLGWRKISAGEETRKMFREKGWQIEDTDKITPEFDRELEARMRKQVEEGRNIIYEGHLAGWNTRDLPHVLRVLLVADEKTQLERFRRREGTTKKQALEMIRKRDRGLTKNYKERYGIENRYDPKYFHLVLDTSKMTPEEESEVVITALKGEKVKNG